MLFSQTKLTEYFKSFDIVVIFGIFVDKVSRKTYPKFFQLMRKLIDTSCIVRYIAYFLNLVACLKLFLSSKYILIVTFSDLMLVILVRIVLRKHGLL